MQSLTSDINPPTLSRADNIHVVLDLDECLIHSFTEEYYYEGQKYDIGQIIEHTPRLQKIRDRAYWIDILDCSTAAGTGTKYHMYGLKRPYLNQFIDFCFAYFTSVSVWSAGKAEYVPLIVERIFGTRKNKLRAIYTFDQTDFSKRRTYKMLDKLESFIDPDSAIIIDDQENATRANKGHGIIIPEWRPSITKLDADEAVLVAIIEWFTNRPDMSMKTLVLPSHEYLLERSDQLVKNISKLKEILLRL